MHIDPSEKKWAVLTLIIAFGMMGVLAAYAVKDNIHPPSNVETIDSTALQLSEEFNEDNLGVHVQPDGSLRVIMVAARYGFFPNHIVVPAGKPITFRMASADVLHGVHTPGANLNTMVVPGYVSEVTTTFSHPGQYSLLCNEYCGLGHDFMWSRLEVVPADQFQVGG